MLDIGALSDNLQQLQHQAAKALRQIMPIHRGKEMAPRITALSMESPASSIATNVTGSVANGVQPICMTPSTEAAPEQHIVPTVQRLVAENTSLREAFHDANRRLSQLEEEKTRFFDEGVFELVNSVCSAPPGSAALEPACENLVARLQQQATTRPTLVSTDSVLAKPVLPSTDSDPAPEGERTNGELDRQAAALSGENAELRRELMRASEVGEALEQQQRAAEDRMHKLEEERTWLAQRLAQCVAAVDTVGPRPALDGGTGASNGNSLAAASLADDGTPLSVDGNGVVNGSRGEPGFDMGRQLQEMSRVLRAELQAELLQRPDTYADAVNGLSSPKMLTSAPVEIPAETSEEARKQEYEIQKAEIEKERQKLEEEKRRLEKAELEKKQMQVQEEQRKKAYESEKAAMERDRLLLEEEKAKLYEKARQAEQMKQQQDFELEQRLRESERRAEALAEENAQLKVQSTPAAFEPVSATAHELSSIGAQLDAETSSLDGLGLDHTDVLSDIGSPEVKFLQPGAEEAAPLDLDDAW
jgi:hypothetical protein